MVGASTKPKIYRILLKRGNFSRISNTEYYGAGDNTNKCIRSNAIVVSKYINSDLISYKYNYC